MGVAFGGAALYYYPSLSLAFAVIWSALWLATAGVAGVYVAVRERRAGFRWGWTMAFGIVSIIASVLAWMNPGATLAALMGLLAGFGIIGGIVMLIAAGRMQALEHRMHASMHPANP